jgi:hypothetical protein
MWKEKNDWKDNIPTEYARKWFSWYVASGKWAAQDSDFVEGLERKEIVSQYGGYADAPMISLTRQGEGSSAIDIAVYSLDYRRFTDEEMAEWREYDEKCAQDTLEDWDEYSAFTDQWQKDHPDLVWLERWERVYPASYMVFIDYNAVGDTIETHLICCCTYPDLLEVLRLHP